MAIKALTTEHCYFIGRGQMASVVAKLGTQENIQLEESDGEMDISTLTNDLDNRMIFS